MVKLNGKKINTAVFISGRGSNLKSLIYFFKKKNSPILIKLIVSNNPNAKGLIYAKNAKINKYIISFKNKKVSEKKLLKKLLSNNINLICLAGFMKILSKDFLSNWYKKIINIHPSILPAFRGLNAVKKALEKKVKYTGCTIHYVDKGIDSGEIIDQRIVKVLKTDNEKKLTKKILKEEYILYIKVIETLEKENNNGKIR